MGLTQTFFDIMSNRREPPSKALKEIQIEDAQHLAVAINT
jgi:hypothetical protein